MKHREYKRINRDSDKAVLLIHGITSTPNCLADFVSLIPDCISVHNLLLEGHGKGVKEFANASMKGWVRQVDEAVAALTETHRQVYILGHSMGALLAIEQGIKNEKIAGLFLVAAPIGIAVKPKIVLNLLKVFFHKVRSDDREAVAVQECFSITVDKDIFLYPAWILRFFGFFSKMFWVRKHIKELKTPCAVYQSGRDELVSKRGAKYFSKNAHICVTELSSSGHCCYDPEDWMFLMDEFRKWIL